MSRAGVRMTATSVSPPRRRGRYGVLFGAIATAFAIQGVSEPGKWEQIVTSTLLGVTLVLAFRSAHMKPKYLRPAAVVVAALVIVSIVEAAGGHVDSGAARVTDALLVLLAPPAIVVGVVRELRARGTVTLEAVLGVLCVYLLVGMFFAFLYGAIDRFGQSPFFTGDHPATVARCLYYSFTTQTTVGYGDLTSRTNLGHTLSVFEALVGQIYLVTVVSLVVANLGRSRTPAAPG